MIRNREIDYNITVHPRFSFVTKHYLNSKPKHKVHEHSLKNLENNTRTSLISDKTKSKIGRSIDYIIHTSKEQNQRTKHSNRNVNFKLVFITLTLSSKQIHTDNELKAFFLNHLITIIKRKYNIDKYIWRAEKQSNGNLHFHILCNKFIPHSELRELWNNVQNKLGYVDRYRDRMKEKFSSGFVKSNNVNDKRTIQQQYKAYTTGIMTDFSSPNSTDIHSLKLVGNLKAYFTTYFYKITQNEGLEGRIWGCSENLSNIKGAKDHFEQIYYDELKRCITNVNYQTKEMDYYSIYFVTYKMLEANNCTGLLKLFDGYIKEQFP